MKNESIKPHARGGISQCSKTKKWQAAIRFHGRKYHIGAFADIKDAERIRDEVVIGVESLIQDAINFITSYQDKYSAKYKEEQFVANTHVSRIKNKTINKNNTSGVRGVAWHSSRKKWIARLHFKGKVYQLGAFDELDDAIKARKDAEEKYYDNFLKEHENEKASQKPPAKDD